MRYSEGFRRSVLRRVLPPKSMPVSVARREFGVGEQSIRSWIERSKDGSISTKDLEIAPNEVSVKGTPSRNSPAA
jgi:transposase-like protein